MVSVDPSSKTLVLKNDQGQQMTVEIKSSSAEKLTPMPGGTLKSEPVPMTELQPGTRVRVDCFDSEGKFCANRITVVTPGEQAGKVYTGQIVSIDPDGQDDRHQHDRRPENSLLSREYNRYALDSGRGRQAR